MCAQGAAVSEPHTETRPEMYLLYDERYGPLTDEAEREDAMVLEAFGSVREAKREASSDGWLYRVTRQPNGIYAHEEFVCQIKAR